MRCYAGAPSSHIDGLEASNRPFGTTRVPPPIVSYAMRGSASRVLSPASEERRGEGSRPPKRKAVHMAAAMAHERRERCRVPYVSRAHIALL